MHYECLICGNQDELEPAAVIGEKYVALKCPCCQVAAARPTPAQEVLTQYYGAYPMTQDNPFKNSQLIELNKDILNFLLGHLRKRKASHDPFRFLDYGFGDGAFLKLVASSGYEATGVEFITDNCEQMKRHCRKHGSTVKVLNLQKDSLTTLAAEQFDLIATRPLATPLPILL